MTNQLHTGGAAMTRIAIRPRDPDYMIEADRQLQKQLGEGKTRGHFEHTTDLLANAEGYLEGREPGLGMMIRSNGAGSRAVFVVGASDRIRECVARVVTFLNETEGIGYGGAPLIIDHDVEQMEPFVAEICERNPHNVELFVCDWQDYEEAV